MNNRPADFAILFPGDQEGLSGRIDKLLTESGEIESYHSTYSPEDQFVTTAVWFRKKD